MIRVQNDGSGKVGRVKNKNRRLNFRFIDEIRLVYRHLQSGDFLPKRGNVFFNLRCVAQGVRIFDNAVEGDSSHGLHGRQCFQLSAFCGQLRQTDQRFADGIGIIADDKLGVYFCKDGFQTQGFCVERVERLVAR